MTEPVSPEVVMDTLFAHQKTAALKSAIELGLFTAIDGGANTTQALATEVRASERGVRILCDFLTTLGLLEKADGRYMLAPTSATFLSQKSPMYMGTIASFLTLPEMRRNLERLTETVREGTVRPDGNTVSTENTVWVEFARSMVPLAMPSALAIAGILQIEKKGATRVLDIAAGHGMYGIVLAQRNPQVEVVAADWAPVLEVAKEHAGQAGVAPRYHTIPGDAFLSDFGSGYDVALVTNFLHHFDRAQCTAFLQKVARALTPGGQVVLVEFVPNADRVTPPIAARFSLTMLAGTPSGDAYTLAELTGMLNAAGLGNVQAYPLPTQQTVVVARK
jgi:2-polyprenyl-3-methyl-5-hydroxy-6-metoxy-1,4-benzoquinol methylase